MIYYKVKAKYDNTPLYKYKNVNGVYYRIYTGDILIGNELFTEKEREMLAVDDCCFKKIEVSKRKTYFFFGARFEQE